MKSRIVIISNPVAKRASGKKVAMASYFLQSKGYDVTVRFTEKQGDAEHLAKAALDDSPRIVIAAGGDGTFNEVVNGIAGSDTPVAILPLGTTNVLAKELDIPEDVHGAMSAAVGNTAKTVYLGRIALTKSPAKSRLFLVMAGIGLDGSAVLGVNDSIKKISGKGSYLYSGFKTWLKSVQEELVFQVNGSTFRGYSAVIGNAAKYGGHFKITPDARLIDPNLYICIFHGRKRSDMVRYVLGIVTGGRHLKFKDVTYLKAESITINGKAHIQLDGDYYGMTPARVEVAKQAVRLIY